MFSFRKTSLAIGLVAASVATAQAQTGPVASQCGADIAKYCANKTHYNSGVRDCLEDHKAALSAACRQALETSSRGTGMGQNMMSADEIMTSLKEQGYTDIRKIERERNGTYEVEATDPNGVRVELYVDGMTGKILKSEPDS